MSPNAALYMMMGLLFGTTLLAIGVAIGVWLGKKSGAADMTMAPSVDPIQFMALVRNMATWTNDFSSDVSKYQSTLQTLSRQAEEKSKTGTKEDVQRLLDQIVSVNNQLQMRLDMAEKKLESQTSQLEDYLTEARTDALTGLANRRAFDQRIDEQYAKAQKSKQPVCLALVDIDHFKKINDTYGHPAGDAVLREMATRLRQFNDQCNLIARYGGEEFAVIFNTSLDKAAATMEQIRLAIAAKPIVADGHSVPVTMSCGVAQLGGEEKIGKMVRRSDEALYAAKQNGRNRVVIHDGKQCSASGKVVTMSMPAGPKLAPVAPEVIAGLEPAPTIDELELRVLKRLDHLVNQEAARNE